MQKTHEAAHSLVGFSVDNIQYYIGTVYKPMTHVATTGLKAGKLGNL